MNLIPTVIEKNDEEKIAYDLFSRLLVDRIIILNGEVNSHTASLIIGQLLFLDNQEKNDITLYINSPGGSVTDGLAIYDTMQHIKSPVSTICVGIAASMAAIILAAGENGKRYILKNSEVMIHEPLGGVQGKASDMKINTDRILKIREKLNKILAKHTKKTVKKVSKDTLEDYYMDAKEALEYGLVDKII